MIRIRRRTRRPVALAVCESTGCQARLELQGDVGEDPLYVVRDAIDLAEDFGWRMSGETWCPTHAAPDGPRRPTPLGEGFAWAHLVWEDSEPVKGSRRLA